MGQYTRGVYEISSDVNTFVNAIVYSQLQEFRKGTFTLKRIIHIYFWPRGNCRISFIIFDWDLKSFFMLIILST